MTGLPATLLGTVPLLLLLSGCGLFSGTSDDDTAFSGGSVPPATVPITGGVLVTPGAGGLPAAEDFARQICARYHRNAVIGAAASENNTARLTYTCE